MASGIVSLIIALIVVVVAVAIIWWIMAQLYQRTSSETAFVRTGLSSRKVVISGGAFVIPVVHDVSRVAMRTLSLLVRCCEGDALITRDRMRVDVEANFFVRVEPHPEAVAAASQTLGERTGSAEQLSALINSKLVDALRSVAAEMSMLELHETRHAFAQRVHDLVAPGLQKNGLGLETVSIARLDQTAREHFNPNNAFDAAGLTALTAEIEERRKARNAIEQEAQIAIQQKTLETEQGLLEITKQEEFARLEQEREIAVRRAAQNADVTRQRAERQQEAEMAEIAAQRVTAQAKIESERAIEEERVARDAEVKALEIARHRELDLAEIERRRIVELAEQEREREIAEQERARSQAQQGAEQARAVLVQAEEAVLTARDLERAHRDNQIAVAKARTEAEQAAIAKVSAAEAEQRAAEAHGTAVTMQAEAEAAAEKLRAAATEIRFAVEAKGRRDLNESDNVMSAETKDLKLKLTMIEHLEAVIRESVKPLENIDGIKILQVDGLAGGERHGEPRDGVSLSDQVVNSALRFRSQAPLVDTLLREIGLTKAEVDTVTRHLPSMHLPEVEDASDPA